MLQIVRDAYSVAWGDIRFMKHNFWNILATSIMSPLLYLLAFGYGLGSGIDMEGVPYIAFVIPGIAALTSLSSSFSSTSTRLNVQRLYYRSFDEMLMCPISPSAIILGKSFLGLFRGLISASLIYILGMCVTSNLHITLLLAVSIVLSCFTFSFLGVMAALLAKSHQSMATFNSLIILPMTFLCGTFFSAATMPNWFQVILYALPLTHASAVVRASALDWSFPWISLTVLFAFCVVFFMIDVYLVKIRRI